jgi:hypothetical protein
MSKTTSAEPQEMREQVEQTRAELGDTVAALAEKTHVKTRAQQQAARLGARAKDSLAAGARAAKRHPRPVAGVLAGVALLAAAIVWRRR